MLSTRADGNYYSANIICQIHLDCFNCLVYEKPTHNNFPETERNSSSISVPKVKKQKIPTFEKLDPHLPFFLFTGLKNVWKD